MIKILLSFFFKKKIQNIHLIPCMYLFNLKREVKNKVYVEASICKAYIDEVILTFISYYFESHLRTRINCVLRYNDGGEMPSSEDFSIFSHLG